MLKTKVLHPEILAALGAAGHLGKVLISDGNFPHNTNPNPRAKIVWANFMPGVVDAATMLRLVTELIPIEAVEVMAPARSGIYAMKTDPPVWDEYRKILREHSDFRGELTQLAKVPFNEQAAKPDVFLVIATAETALYANVLITIGVVQ
ncbi:MAG: RbsD/FucU family protein [Planctomycetota bacterium]|nr:RbsD/FucU family protein [Planctomycetota bacterium]